MTFQQHVRNAKGQKLGNMRCVRQRWYIRVKARQMCILVCKSKQTDWMRLCILHFVGGSDDESDCVGSVERKEASDEIEIHFDTLPFPGQLPKGTLVSSILHSRADHIKIHSVSRFHSIQTISAPTSFNSLFSQATKNLFSCYRLFPRSISSDASSNVL